MRLIVLNLCLARTELYPMSKINLAPDPFYPPWLPPVAFSPWGELRSYDDIAMMNLTWPFEPIPVDYQVYVVASVIKFEIQRTLSGNVFWGITCTEN